MVSVVIMANVECVQKGRYTKHCAIADTCKCMWLSLLSKHFRVDMSTAQHKNAIIEQLGITCLLHFDMFLVHLCSNLSGCVWKECAKQ